MKTLTRHDGVSCIRTTPTKQQIRQNSILDEQPWKSAIELHIKTDSHFDTGCHTNLISNIHTNTQRIWQAGPDPESNTFCPWN